MTGAAVSPHLNLLNFGKRVSERGGGGMTKQFKLSDEAAPRDRGKRGEQWVGND